MAQLVQDTSLGTEYAFRFSTSYAAAINRQKFRLLSGLSGGRQYSAAELAPALPSSMTEPVAYDGSLDEELTEVDLVAIDESEDVPG